MFTRLTNGISNIGKKMKTIFPTKWKTGLTYQALRAMNIKRKTLFLTDEEKKVFVKLHAAFPGADKIAVLDVTGRARVFDIIVLTDELKYLQLLDQHRLILELVKKEIPKMKIFRINTCTKKNYYHIFDPIKYEDQEKEILRKMGKKV